jgi:hypothetical protein
MEAGTGQLRLRTADLHWRAIDGEVIALEGTRSAYLSANRAGTLLWEALAEGATREQLSGRLVAAYGIDRERAQADVDAYVAQLAAHGLLES